MNFKVNILVQRVYSFTVSKKQLFSNKIFISEVQMKVQLFFSQLTAKCWQLYIYDVILYYLFLQQVGFFLCYSKITNDLYTLFICHKPFQGHAWLHKTTDMFLDFKLLTQSILFRHIFNSKSYKIQRRIEYWKRLICANNKWIMPIVKDFYDLELPRKWINLKSYM